MSPRQSRDETRLKALRRRIEEAKADAFFSLAPPDNQYLTGFIGSTSAVIVTREEALFLCDFRYTEQARAQVAGFTVEEVSGGFLKGAGERLTSLGVSVAAYEPAYLTVGQLRTVESAFRGRMEPVSDIVATLRMTKTADEVKRIREASRLAEGVLDDLIGIIKKGLSEAELAGRFEYEFKRRGSDGASFDTIALFGPRSSMPHGRPGETRLKRGDIVLLDLGCRKVGYCSDLTRTYAYGTIPGAWFKEIYEVVLTAQQAALKAIRPGVRCCDVDAVARGVIADAGYGKHFGHGLGHGVGIEIHESPRLNPECQVVLLEGMALTVEPGIYLPKRGGVRVEDLVVVTKTGCTSITRAPKELRVLEV